MGQVLDSVGRGSASSHGPDRWVPPSQPICMYTSLSGKLQLLTLVQVIHSHAYTVLTVFLALSYLALIHPLQAFHYVHPPTLVSQKFAVTLSLYSFTWVLLVASTVAIGARQTGSLYWTTVFNLGAWFAAILELIRAGRRGDPGNEVGSRSDLFSTREEREGRAEGAVRGRRRVRGVLYEAPEHPYGADAEAGNGHDTAQAQAGEGEVIETDPTEITPLMHQHRHSTQGGTEYVTVDPPEDVSHTAKPADEYGWWIGQMFVLVPVTALLLFQLEVLLLNALMHTLVDGSHPLLGGLHIHLS